jgi:hypothetical protein
MPSDVIQRTFPSVGKCHWRQNPIYVILYGMTEPLVGLFLDKHEPGHLSKVAGYEMDDRV